MNNRITPEQITKLAENEIFVFGSNLSGRHGKGAAKTTISWNPTWNLEVGKHCDLMQSSHGRWFMMRVKRAYGKYKNKKHKWLKK